MPFTLFPRTDQRSQSRGLFGVRDTSGIDLREEFRKFVYGTSRELGHGYWMILRHFDRSRYAEAYNRATGQGVFFPPTGEGVGGPMYPFEDIPVRTVHKDLTIAASRFQVEQSVPGGRAPVSYRNYYLKHDLSVNESDVLYEIDYLGEDEPTNITPPYLRTWSIQEITPYRDIGGRVEYYQVLAGLSPITSEV